MGHRPADHTAAEGVNNDRQIHKSGPGRDIRHIGDPELIGVRSREVALNEIGRRAGLAIPTCGARTLAPTHARQAQLPHQSCNALAAHSDALIDEFSMNARRPP